MFQPPEPSTADAICILGAREHNLKNLSAVIPRGKFVVVTGVSGSGKSTLAFDLIFAEGQRRFLDSMNAYARQFVEQMSRPDVDLITGIPPTVSIEQRNSRGGGKSTVMNLIAKFYLPTEGQVLIDGHDARTLSSSFLHSRMGNVLQSHVLFSVVPEAAML